MITNYEGDIFNAPVDIIVHQSNCFCTMGSGIAKEIKKRYPRAYEADRVTPRGDIKKLGHFSFALANKDQERTIINLYGQYSYGKEPKQYTDYKALIRGFENLHSFLIKMNMQDKIIGIPYKIGSDRGGGDWPTVEGIINSIFSTSPIKVLICKKSE
jgi:O-acetyl-ADP-ribose deacetylase (regulator of RNase III)